MHGLFGPHNIMAKVIPGNKVSSNTGMVDFIPTTVQEHCGPLLQVEQEKRQDRKQRVKNFKYTNKTLDTNNLYHQHTPESTVYTCSQFALIRYDT